MEYILPAFTALPSTPLIAGQSASALVVALTAALLTSLAGILSERAPLTPQRAGRRLEHTEVSDLRLPDAA